MIVLMLSACCLTYSIFLFGTSLVKRLTREDGLIETVGAICFLGSSVLFFLGYLYSRPSDPVITVTKTRTRRNVCYMLLALVFLFGFLEEISWGQRFLGIETPEVMQRYNRQHEFNIHNLKWFHGRDELEQEKGFVGKLLNMDRLFSVFWFTFCLCIPVVYSFSQSTRTLIDRIRLPIVPISFGILFVSNYAISKLFSLNPHVYKHGLVETKESLFAFFFLCVAANEAYGRLMLNKLTGYKRRTAGGSPHYGVR